MKFRKLYECFPVILFFIKINQFFMNRDENSSLLMFFFFLPYEDETKKVYTHIVTSLLHLTVYLITYKFYSFE